jgi:hypothetical protein
LADKKHQWQGTRCNLERETQGLESRVHNLRCKLLDQEGEVARLEGVLAGMRGEAEGAPAATALAAPGPAAAQGEAPAAVKERERQLAVVEGDLQRRSLALQDIAGDLADQRAQVAEQLRRLVAIQAGWQSEREEALAELESQGRRLDEREQQVAVKEQALEAVMAGLRQEQEGADHLRRHLEAWQARLAAREADWERERDCLLAEVRGREEVAERRLALLADLRQRWQERRCQEVGRLRTQFALAGKLHQECTRLRDQWLGRRAILEQKQRALVERALVLEQYWRDQRDGADPAEAEKRRERLRQRWAALSCAAERVLDRERQALRAEAARVDRYYRRLEKMAEQTADRQGDLSQRETAWEHDRTLAENQLAELRQELRLVKTQRDVYWRQLEERALEVERLVQLLLDDGRLPALPLVQAA